MTLPERIAQCRAEQKRCADEYHRGHPEQNGCWMGIEDWLWEEVHLMNQQATKEARD